MSHAVPKKMMNQKPEPENLKPRARKKKRKKKKEERKEKGKKPAPLINGNPQKSSRKAPPSPLIPQHLLDPDKQLPIARLALSRMEELNTPIPRPQAIEPDTRPGDDVAVGNLEPVVVC
jgi:hypothetical protein